MRAAILASLGLGWLIIAVAAYYMPHKPIGPAFMWAVILLLRDLAVATGILAAAGGLGRCLAYKPHSDSLAALSLQAALGLGIASLVFLFLGLVGLYQTWLGWVLLLGLLAGFSRSVGGWLSGWKAILESLASSSRFAKGLAGLVFAWLMMAFLEAAAPPVRFDALVYHLALPQNFLAEGSLAVTPDNPFWGLPLGTEMLYTWAMLVARPQAAALLGWGIGVTALAGTLGLACSFGRSAGWVAVASMLAGETLAASLGWAYADWTVALYGVGILAALEGWRGRQELKRLLVAGILLGFAVGAKYTGGIALAGGAAMIAAISRRQRPWRPLLVYLIASIAVSAPWLVKNLIMTGSPLYPFLGANPWVSSARQVFYQGEGLERSLAEIVFTPVLASLQGIEGAPGFAADIGPLMIGLLPGVLLLRSKWSQMKPLVAYFGAGWVLWALAGSFSVLLGQSRLYYVLFPAWSILAAAGYEGFKRLRFRSIRFGQLAGALVLLSLSLSLVSGGLKATRYRLVPVLLGLESESSYLFHRLTTLYAASEAARSLAGGSRVLNLWEPRVFYCHPVCRPDAWLDRWYEARRLHTSVGEILEGWRRAGVTHILLYRTGMEFTRDSDARYAAEDWELLESLLSNLVPSETFGDSYVLYRVPN